MGDDSVSQDISMRKCDKKWQKCNESVPDRFFFMFCSSCILQIMCIIFHSFFPLAVGCILSIIIIIIVVVVVCSSIKLGISSVFFIFHLLFGINVFSPSFYPPFLTKRSLDATNFPSKVVHVKQTACFKLLQINFHDKLAWFNLFFLQLVVMNYYVLLIVTCFDTLMFILRGNNNLNDRYFERRAVHKG